MLAAPPIHIYHSNSEPSPCYVCNSELINHRAMRMLLEPISRSIVSELILVLCTLTHTDTAIAWSGQLFYDLIIFVLTLVQSLRIRKGSRSITNILLRDGVSIELTILVQFIFESLGSLYFGCVGYHFCASQCS